VTLDRDTLRQAIVPLFRPTTMPTGPVPDAVRQWVTAYVRYAQGAVAGGTVPSTLVPVPGPSGLFFTSLDSALRTMWTAVAWTGPALIGTTLLVPPLSPALVLVSSQLMQSRDPDLALSLITGALHTYTLSITVSVVPPTGTAVVVPLT
jgi:hypothetical protein